MLRAAKRHPVLIYFVLAAAWFWASLALDRVKGLHFWAPLVGALAPAVSAIFVTAITKGEAAVRQLGSKLWQWGIALGSVGRGSPAALVLCRINRSSLLDHGIQPNSTSFATCGVPVAATVCSLLATAPSLRWQTHKRSQAASP